MDPRPTPSTHTPTDPSSGEVPAREAARLRKQIADLELELEQARKDLDAIRHSTLWRTTILIRGPIMLALRLRHGWRLLPGEVARRGGWYPQLCEWWREFRAYGWSYFSRINTYELNPGPGSGEHDRNDYAAWKRRFGTSHPSALPQTPAEQPDVLLSVVVPVYRPPLDLLRQAIESVQAQTYPHWELCIADDASRDPDLTDYLQTLAAHHPNIRVALREKNGHISACTNSALSLAKGDYIVLLDQDDLLPAHALERVAQTIAQHPEAGIIFSDEDRIDETGAKALGAYFKPDFNYDLFLGHNLISHLGVYRRSLIEEIGGFKLGLEGSQDWDLALRALERLRPDQIVHIPEVLYHWRAIEGSTALAQSEKSYTSTASRQAIKDHLARMGVDGEVLPSTHLPAFNWIRYALPEERRTATLILPFDYPAEQLRRMVKRLRNEQGDIRCDILLACSESIQAEDLLSPQELATTSIKRVATPAGASLSQRVNMALPLATGHFVALVTIPLTDVTPAWLEELCRIADQDRCGFVAPRVVDGAGTEDIFDHGGILFTDDMRAVHAHKGLFTDMTGYAGRGILQQSFMALSPAVLVARRELLQDTNPFTEAFGGRLDLVDKCLSFHQKGLANIWTPEVEVRFNDLRFAGRANLLTELGPFGSRRQAWIAKWGRRPHDPAYNPNLSPDGDFALNWRSAS